MSLSYKTQARALVGLLLAFFGTLVGGLMIAAARIERRRHQ